MNSRRMEISLGVLVLLALAILGYFALRLGHLKGLGSLIRADVYFDDAAGIVEGTSVKVAGVAVGRVESLKVEFDRAKAILAIDERAGIREDAVVSIRARSLLGEKYVDLRPGSRDAPLLEEGAHLKADGGIVELDQLVGDLGPVVQSLDVDDVGPLLSEIKGMVRENREPLREAIANLNHLLIRLEKVNFDDPAMQDDLRTLLHNLRVTSDDLPMVLDKADVTLSQLAERSGPMLDRVDGLLTRIEPAAERLPETVNRSNEALQDMSAMVARLEALLDRLETVDYSLLRKLLRDEGLLVRFHRQPVEWEGDKLFKSGNATDGEEEWKRWQEPQDLAPPGQKDSQPSVPISESAPMARP